MTNIIYIGNGALFSGGAGRPDIDRVFATFAARDAYYDSPDPHLDELTQGETTILVEDDGSGSAVIQDWVGATNPGSYDNTNWITRSASGVDPGTANGQTLRWVSANSQYEPTDLFLLNPVTSDVNIDGYHVRRITGSTTDATATTLFSIGVDEGDQISVEIIGFCRNSGLTERGSFHVNAFFYRQTGGDVTQEGTAGGFSITTYRTTATIDIDIVADTTSQNVDIDATGLAATNMDWVFTVRWRTE